MVKTLLSVNFFRNYLNFVIDSLFFFLVEFTDAERPKKAKEESVWPIFVDKFTPCCDRVYLNRG